MIKYLVLALLLLSNILVYAQCNVVEFAKIKTDAEKLVFDGKYEAAVLRYTDAVIACPDSGAKVKTQIAFVLSKIEDVRTRNTEVIARFIQMQDRMEVANFDKAVREQFPDWKGYDNYAENKQLRTEILNAIDTLNLSGYELIQLPQQVSQCINLKSINLLGNAYLNWNQTFNLLSKLPVTNCWVSVMDFDSIPQPYRKYITGIQLLKSGLQSVPDNILNHAKLVYLDISGKPTQKNNLKSFPDKLYQLSHLKYLRAAYCNMETLSASIALLKQLHTLYLWDNKLSAIPQEIGQLSNLQYLDLGLNKLLDIPVSVYNLSKLTYLGLFENKLAMLPASIEKLVNLDKIDLRNNSLTFLPENFGLLTNLTMANLSGNQLKQLPNSLGSLKKINYLNLSSNNLSSLPPTFSGMQQLKYLYLENNKLVQIPVEVAALSSVEIIDMSNNQIGTIAPEIKNLNKLQKLVLRSNLLTTIPSEISLLQGLLQLDLTGNAQLNVSQLFASLANCKNQLNISTNIAAGNTDKQVLLVLVPDNFVINQSVTNLRNLTLLDLSMVSVFNFPNFCKAIARFEQNIQLTTQKYEMVNTFAQLLIIIPPQKRIPSEIGLITRLTGINFSNNSISEIPKQISDLKYLYSIDLSNNLLTALPAELNSLPALKYLNLSGNPVNASDEAIINPLIQRLIAYYPPSNQVQEDISTVNLKAKLQKLEQYDMQTLSASDKQFYAEVLNLYAVELQKAGKTDSAIIHFRQATEIYPLFFYPWRNMGNSYLIKKQYANAIGSFVRALQIDSISEQAGYCYTVMAPALLYTRQFALAEQYALKALSFPQFNNMAKLGLARAYLFQGKYNDAKKIYLEVKNVLYGDNLSGAKLALQQLEEMYDYGITHPDVEKIYKLLK